MRGEKWFKGYDGYIGEGMVNRGTKGYDGLRGASGDLENMVKVINGGL